MSSHSATAAEGVMPVSTAAGGKFRPGRIAVGEAAVDKICLGGGYRLPASAADTDADTGKISLGGGYRLPIQGG
jgi:hypothetical protein